MWRQWAVINRALAGSLDFSDVLQAIAESARSLLSADATLVLLDSESRELRVRAASGVDLSLFSDLSEPIDERVIDEVRRRLQLPPGAGVMAVPIVSEETIHGIVLAVRDHPPDEEESQMLDALADQAALALRNARLHEMELDAVRRKQEESQLALVESERRAAEAIRSQERWLEAVFDLAPSPILIIAPEQRRILFANRAAARITSQPQSLVPNEVLERISRHESLGMMQTEWNAGGERRILQLHGEVFPPLYGHPEVAVVVLHDITSLKQIEAELRRANDAKDEFLATLSHELRTPLTVILGWTGMMEVSDDETTRKSALEAIAGSVRAQNKMIDDLLDVSRIVRGNLEVDRKEFDLSVAIQDAASSMRPMALQKEIALTDDVEPGIMISGDALRFRQLLTNLVSNALKFTPAGGQIDIALHRDSDEAVLKVTDSGRGIAPDFLPFVFERFRQEDVSSTREHGGLGLGLAIVKGIVDQHQGSVQAFSEGSGKGTTITVRVPEERQRSGDRRNPSLDPNREGSPAMTLHGVNVLLVEDDSDTCGIFRIALENAGAEVTTAGRADDALSLFRSSTPRIIVSDIALPGGDGHELLRSVRKEAGSVVPAIAVTAYAGAEARQKALDSGFDEFLAKPVATADLISTIARLAARDSSERH
ncbi:MAG: ATP-binding protein [Thermoanaerobaculia bacterium]